MMAKFIFRVGPCLPVFPGLHCEKRQTFLPKVAKFSFNLHISSDLSVCDVLHQHILEASLAVMWKAEDKYGRHSMTAIDESWWGLSTLSGALTRVVARPSSGEFGSKLRSCGQSHLPFTRSNGSFH